MAKFLALAVILGSFSFSCFADLVAGSDGASSSTGSETLSLLPRTKTLDECIQDLSKEGSLKIEPWTEKNPVLSKLRACTGNPALEANSLVKDEIISKAGTGGGIVKTASGGCICYGKNMNLQTKDNPGGSIGGAYKLLDFVIDHPACVAMGGVRCI